MTERRTVVVLDIAPRTCRVCVVEQRHSAGADAQRRRHPPVPGSPQPTVTRTGSDEPVERTVATTTRATGSPSSPGEPDVRALLDIALRAPGRHREGTGVAAVVTVRRPATVDGTALAAALLPGVPVLTVEALDLFARQATALGDVLVVLDAGADEDGDPLVHWLLCDDLGRRRSAPSTGTPAALAALVRADTHLGVPAGTGVTCLVGDATGSLRLLLRTARITDGPHAGDPVDVTPPGHLDPAGAVRSAGIGPTWPHRRPSA